MKDLKIIIYQYLKEHPPSLELFRLLEKTGNIYLIGGVLREFKDKGDIIELRDIDIVIDIKNRECWEKVLTDFTHIRNNFGGYKLICSELVVDIWPLDETWAYRKGFLKCSPDEYVQCLTDTVFLNMDAIIYDLKNNIWYDKKYKEAMESGILDIVLEYNPQIPLNIVRAMVLKKRYSMTYSQKLRNAIKQEIKNNKKLEDELVHIQNARYKKQILSYEEIQKELYNINEVTMPTE